MEGLCNPVIGVWRSAFELQLSVLEMKSLRYTLVAIGTSLPRYVVLYVLGIRV